jgi:hypothetical protein
MAAINNELPSPPSVLSIEVPKDWESGDLARVQSVQAAVREKFAEGFAKGYAAVAATKTANGSAYQLAPWSDF